MENKSENKLRCLVVDDEPIAIEGIVNYINKVDFLSVSATCSSAIRASEILKEEPIDLMFLDVNMPLLSGVEFLESLANPPMVIFTTAYSEYALEAFRLQVIDYLLKPISFQRFFQAVQKAQDVWSRQEQKPVEVIDDMYIRQGDTFVKIAIKGILFAEGLQNYIKLYCVDKTYTIHQTMQVLEDSLPVNLFFRIHKSYLVNTSYISSITGNQLAVNDYTLPISRYRKTELLEKYVLHKLMSK